MPDPAAFSDRASFLEACIPMALEEGNAEDQEHAVAMCIGMWEQRAAEADVQTRGARRTGVDVMIKERKPTVRIKQIGEDGTGLARIATLGVVDKDGDVTKAGAFGDQHAKILPAHDWGNVPLGKARVFEHGDEALSEFKFNLDVEDARKWHSWLKFDMDAGGGPTTAEWSYGFSIPEGGAKMGDHEGSRVRFLEKLKVHEISPVVLGAGVNTGTLMVKRARTKAATPAHQTNVSPEPWDGPDNEKRVVMGDELKELGPRIYAWRDPDEDPKTKQAWRFIHHFVQAGGVPGAASTRACLTGIAVLNGARGGTTIPAADRKGVYDHLAGHLRDADIEPPELRSAEECGIKLLDHVQLLAWEAEALAGRVKDKRVAREEKGRDLGGNAKQEIATLESHLHELHCAMSGLKQAVEVGEACDADKLLADFMRIRSKVAVRGEIR